MIDSDFLFLLDFSFLIFFRGTSVVEESFDIVYGRVLNYYNTVTCKLDALTVSITLSNSNNKDQKVSVTNKTLWFMLIS